MSISTFERTALLDRAKSIVATAKAAHRDLNDAEEGEVIFVRLRDQQYRAVDGEFRMEHHIEKVLEHRRALPPEQLPFDEDVEPESIRPDIPNSWESP